MYLVLSSESRTGGLQDRWRKVISELLMLLLKTLLSLALVGYLKNDWFLVVMLGLCHNLWSLILSLKAFWWSPDCPIPSVNLEEKGHLPSHLIIFWATVKACTILSPLLVLRSLACQGVRLCRLLLSSLKWGAASVRITSQCCQVPTFFCCSRARCHLNFSCFYMLSWQQMSELFKAVVCPSLSFSRQGCFLSNGFCSQLPTKLLWI